MNIETKYDLGHMFWVPRVYNRTQTEELSFEGETWYREVDNYVPVVKQKRIAQIDIRLNAFHDPVIQYGLENVDQNAPDMYQWYDEKTLTDRTEQEALEFAEKWALNHKEPYYGV